MGRILLFIIIAFIIWMLVRGLFKSRGKSGATEMPRETKSDDMVACRVCGVHIPKAEALLDNGTYRCRDEDVCIHRKT